MFQYMLLLRGATGLIPATADDLYGFNTCSSCEEQLKRDCVISGCLVSIHAPLARSNSLRRLKRLNVHVSIHAPLARSKKCSRIRQSTKEVSIHAPLARSNGKLKDPHHVSSSFNTCSSCEEQRGNINRSGSKCKSKNRAKYQLSFVKEHYCILRFLIIV